MSNFMASVDRENFGQDRGMDVRAPVTVSIQEVERLLQAVAAEYGVEDLSLLFPKEGELNSVIKELAIQAWHMERTLGYLDLTALTNTARIIVETNIKAHNLLGGA